MTEPSLDEVFAENFQDAEDAVMENAGVTEVEKTEADAAEKPPVDEPPSSEPQEEKPIPAEQFKGYLDEREKRQKLERELQALRANKPDEPRADPLEDPEKFAEQFDQKLNAALFEQERKFMSRLHDDWSEAEAWINEQLGDNAAIAARLQGSNSILDDAYKMFQQHKELEKLSDVDSIKAQLREEVLAELKQEQAGQSQAQAARSAATSKPSLATTGTSTGVSTEGLLSLEDLLGSDINSRPK